MSAKQFQVRLDNDKPDGEDTINEIAALYRALTAALVAMPSYPDDLPPPVCEIRSGNVLFTLSICDGTTPSTP